MAAIEQITKSLSVKERCSAAMHEFWNSPDKLGSLITAANWGIAITLLVAFACTAIVVKATSQKDALTAVVDIAKAQHIAELDGANLTLRGQVATLELSAGNIQIDLAKQREKAALAEKSLLELQQKVRWRTVTDDERQRFFTASAHLKKGPVKVTVASGDPEGLSFANELRSMLIDSGYTVSSVDVVPLLYTQYSVGLSVVIQSSIPLTPSLLDSRRMVVPDDGPIAHGLPLAEALKMAGFTLTENGILPQYVKNEVEILVGRKP
jgi:hypothetical protein